MSRDGLSILRTPIFHHRPIAKSPSVGCDSPPPKPRTAGRKADGKKTPHPQPPPKQRRSFAKMREGHAKKCHRFFGATLYDYLTVEWFFFAVVSHHFGQLFFPSSNPARRRRHFSFQLPPVTRGPSDHFGVSKLSPPLDRRLLVCLMLLDPPPLLQFLE